MFECALSLGANIHIENKQHLTPLTLASYLAKKQVKIKFTLKKIILDV